MRAGGGEPRIGFTQQSSSATGLKRSKHNSNSKHFLNIAQHCAVYFTLLAQNHLGNTYVGKKIQIPSL